MWWLYTSLPFTVTCTLPPRSWTQHKRMQFQVLKRVETHLQGSTFPRPKLVRLILTTELYWYGYYISIKQDSNITLLTVLLHHWTEQSPLISPPLRNWRPTTLYPSWLGQQPVEHVGQCAHWSAVWSIFPGWRLMALKHLSGRGHPVPNSQAVPLTTLQHDAEGVLSALEHGMRCLGCIAC